MRLPRWKRSLSLGKGRSDTISFWCKGTPEDVTMNTLSGFRVCHVASGDLWAGAEVQIASLLGALRRYKDLQVSAVVLNEGRLMDELRMLGIPVTLLDESRLGSFEIFTALKSHVRHARPDIIHSHRYKEHILGVFAAKLSHNPIVIQTYHGLEENLRGVAALKMAGYTWLNTIVTNLLAQGVIGVSEDIAARLRRRLPFARVRCIRNGLDLERVASTVDGTQLRQELGIPLDAFVVGSVGRLMPIKGIEYLIRGFGMLMRDGEAQSNRLIIVGDGPLRISLDQLAQEQGVAAQTMFLGERRDVYDVMRAFDVFTLPSLHEGVPMVLLEAMAIGVPIVASGVGGIPEVVTDGKEASLIPAQDPQAIEKALRALRDSTELRERMIEAARHRVEAQFSICNTAGLVRDLYRELLAVA
jgi:glycosyltransferase involved in cell wall biosynthesis